MKNLFVIHHEMGHVQYLLQYKDQPELRECANNDKKLLKVLDVMALSVATPEHLHKIRLLDKVENDDEADINFLMQRARKSSIWMPYRQMEMVFSQETSPHIMNVKWWELRY